MVKRLYKGYLYKFITGIYTLKIFDNFVAYRDIGEGREQGSGSFENLVNSLLLTAIFALFSNILGTYLLRQNS